MTVTTGINIFAVAERGHRCLPVLHLETLQTRRKRCGQAQDDRGEEHQDLNVKRERERQDLNVNAEDMNVNEEDRT